MNFEEERKLYNIPFSNKIALFTGRPQRSTIINQDDIINLHIALHKSESFEEFLEEI